MENLKKKENLPLLIQEGIFEIKMPTLIIILDDSRDEKIQTSEINKKVEIIKKSNVQNYVSYLEINSNNSSNIINDIWSKYIHKLDLYSTKVNNIDIVRGGYISNEEKENFKMIIFKFFNENIKNHLQKLVFEYEENINYSKKGFKNTIFNIFKKSDKIENILSLNIYKVIRSCSLSLLL